MVQAVGLQILVVEDCEDCALTTAMLLRMYGHEVRTSGDGPQALEIAHQYKPDVVLLDIGLPGMNGFEVARRLAEDLADNPPLIVAVTGFGRAVDRQHSAEAGIHLHLVKPVAAKHLESILQDHQQNLEKAFVCDRKSRLERSRDD